MTVSILLHGIQRSVADTDRIRVPVSKSTRVSDLLHLMRERYPQLPLDDDIILMTVNNRVATGDQVLEPDDKVCFLPHIGGG